MKTRILGGIAVALATTAWLAVPATATTSRPDLVDLTCRRAIIETTAKVADVMLGHQLVAEAQFDQGGKLLYPIRQPGTYRAAIVSHGHTVLAQQITCGLVG